MATASLRDLLPCLHQTAAARFRGLSDREVLDCYLARKDQGAFEALLCRHGPRVFAVCRQVLGDGDDLDDAFQATFLVLLDKARRIRWHDSLGAWLAAVAHRVAVRARARRRRRPCQEPPVDVAASTGTSGEGGLLWREACAILHEELDRLPDRFRLPLLLCYLEGLSRDEAAGRLGWSLGAVKAGLERGRAQLRRRLLRRGVALSAGLLATLGSPVTTAAPPARLLQATLLTTGGAPSLGVAALVAWAVPVKPAGHLRLVIGLLLAAGLCVALGAATRPHPSGDEDAALATPRHDPPAPDDSGERRTVRGRVLTPDGKPAANATVYRLDWRSPARKWVETKAASTGPDGRFEVEVAGLWVLAASAEGFAPACTSKWRPPEGEVMLTLAHDTPVRGRLLDLRGKPVAGALVRVLNVLAPAGGDLQSAYRAYRANPEPMWEALPRQLPGGTAGLPAEVKTDADGAFELNGLGRGRVAELHFEALGIEATPVDVVTAEGFDPRAAGQTTPRRPADGRPAVYGPTFTHSAGPDRVIRGTVRDAATGKPLAGVKVVGTVGPLDGLGRPAWRNTVEATTDAAGRFLLPGLPGGRRRFLHAQAGENPHLDRVVEVEDAGSPGPIRMEIRLRRCVVLEGRLTDMVTGKGVKGWAEHVPLEDNEQLQSPDTGLYQCRFGLYPTSGAWAFTDDHGRFRLRVLPGPGVVLARAGITGSPVARYTAARAAAADRKYLRGDDRGPKGALAKLVGMLFPPRGRGPAEEVFRTVPGGPLRWWHGYAIIHPAVRDESAACTIRLDPGWTVSGKVVGPDGRPLAGAKAAGVHGPDERRPTTFRTDAFTAYAVDPRRPRPLFFVHEGRKLAGTFPVRGVEKGTPVVKLRPWAAVTGRVVRADGTPAAGADVRYGMTDPEADDLIPRVLYRSRPPVETDHDGRFRIEGLFPGYGVRFFAYKPGHRSGETFPPVTLAAGKVTDLGEVRFPGTPPSSR
jgi:RNA polymerase sigma factor (sigma-70 family)